MQYNASPFATGGAMPAVDAYRQNNVMRSGDYWRHYYIDNNDRILIAERRRYR